MARRQALRELQIRLAERMRLARTQARERAWLAVECAGRGFLIPLAEAGEIFSAGPLVALPYAQPWCLGVANLRGQLHTVVDLAVFLGVAPAGRPRPAAGRDDAPQWLAFNPSLEINAALRLDRLAGLRHETQMQAQTAPLQNDAAPADKPADDPSARAAAARLPSFAGARLRDGDGRLWQELSLAALARHAAFLHIGA